MTGQSGEVEPLPLPKVTPSLLARADTACARRVARELEGDSGSASPVNRGRLRDAFLEALRKAHLESRAPAADLLPAPDALLPEEAAVFRHAAGWYATLYADRPGRTHHHHCDHPTVFRRRGIRAGGWVDLTLEGPGGEPELRQLGLWGRILPDDPLDDVAARLAVLRLWTPTPGQDGWATDRPLRLSVADLVRGDRRERVVELRTDAGWLGDWLDERVATVHALAAEGTARPGTECGFCRFFSGCPAHEHGANRSAPRGDLRPGVIALTPSSLDRWIACPRAWRARHLLGLPESDGGGSPDRGLLTHDLLRLVHTGGSCQDDGHVEDVLRAHHVEGPGPIRDHLCAHRRRCPIGAEALGHEVEVARFHRDPLLAFVATARIDAAWVHDGLLDARDYKTGTVRYPRVSDDPRARLQAWVLAPRAAARGLRLRVRYEHLAPEVDDDPDPFDPEEDDLAAIEEELRGVVAAIRADDPFGGVADARTCRHCGYRSICPQSAAPGEPTWPAVEAPDDEGEAPFRSGSGGSSGLGGRR